MTIERLTPPISGRGERPRTTPRTPHMQLDQFAPEGIQQRLWTWMSALDKTTTGRSNISEARSRAVHVDRRNADGPADAFFTGTEISHLHGDGSGSLHATLPPALARDSIAQGWAEPHPVVAAGFGHPTWVMIYGPRNEEELQRVISLLDAGYRYARFGESWPRRPRPHQGPRGSATMGE